MPGDLLDPELGEPAPDLGPAVVPGRLRVIPVELVGGIELEGLPEDRVRHRSWETLQPASADHPDIS